MPVEAMPTDSTRAPEAYEPDLPTGGVPFDAGVR